MWAGRWRFILRADPADTSPHPHATEDSLDAGWFTLDEIAQLPLRSLEALTIFEAVARGCPELPLDSGYRVLPLE